MSDREPESDWEQPRLEFSRGGSPHYSGGPQPEPGLPTRKGKPNLLLWAIVIVVVVGIVAFLVTR